MPKTSSGAMNSEVPAGLPLRWRVFANEEALIDAARGMIATTAAEAIARRGAFRIVLAGGRTPQRLYRSLRSLATDWTAWHVYFGDERCLPMGDVERNDAMADEAWLAWVGIPPRQVYRIPVELGAVEAARAYSGTVAAVDRFDLVLLGLGEDGHAASLFPRDETGFAPAAPAAVAVHDAPKPPSARVSLSAARLACAERVVFLVVGEGKREAVARWFTGELIPAARIAATHQEVWLDRAAAPGEKNGP